MVAWLLIINVLAFAMYGLDKYKAMKHAWRIPEATLLGLAALGGAYGALLAMQMFRHKTRHIKFTLTVPLLAIAEAALLAWLMTRGIIH